MRPSSAPPGPAIAAVAPPKPPSSTEAIERFIALAIWSVRIVPLRADEHARDDQRGVVQRDAGGGRAQPREGVQGAR